MTATTTEVEAYTVTIEETPDGWVLSWRRGDSEIHNTAAEAARAVRDMGHVLATGGHSSTLTIEWRPTTKIGRSVVRAIASA